MPSQPQPQLSHFLMNKQSSVPLHVQLKEQIRYAILNNSYRPGELLPSIRELTAQLGIHRNTVHRVYLELQASGLLISLPGKGVCVSENLARPISRPELHRLDQLIEDFFDEANTLGINAITLSRLTEQKAADHDIRKPIAAFVECTEHQSQQMSKTLSENLGIHVQHVLLEDLRLHPTGLSTHLKHVITSVFHYDEVTTLLHQQQRRIHALTFQLHPASKEQLSNIDAKLSLIFICHDANTEEVIGKEIQDASPANISFNCANLEAPEHALELLKKSQVVAITEPAIPFCIKHCTPQQQLIELHFSLGHPSVEKVAGTLLYKPF